MKKRFSMKSESVGFAFGAMPTEKSLCADGLGDSDDELGLLDAKSADLPTAQVRLKHFFIN